MPATFRLAALAAAATFAAMSVPSGPARADACSGVTFGASFASSYACNNIGSVTGLPGSYGGLTFLDSGTLLIGGNALDAGGVVGQVGVTRDAGNHIIGFSGPATSYAAAPNIDGGLAFGPGGNLYYTAWPNNQLGQIKPGSTSADKIVNLPAGLSSVGAVVFVPPGFAGAGGMKLLSYGNGSWFAATLTPDGTGTYTVSAAPVTTTAGGAEGVVYIAGTGSGFGGNDSVIVTDYSDSELVAYQIDANGDPDASTASTFLSGVANAEGAVIDPLTGDELLSINGNQVVVISGFSVPEPASIALFGASIAGFGLLRRRR